jgi:uncharacterized membrane protein
MSELVAFVFRDQFRAPEVLNELRRRDWCWVKDLDEAVVVTLNETGKARVHLSVDLSTYKGAGWARLWGSLLSSTLFMPITGLMVDATNRLMLQKHDKAVVGITSRLTREGSWWQKALEQSDDFKRDVAALIAPGSSAIFMFLKTEDAPYILKQLGNYGDTIIHTSLRSEHDETMLTLLATDKESRS